MCLSLLQFFLIQYSPETLQELLNFTINCELSGSQLNCSVDERFEPTLDLPEATYCTINNDPKTRQKCKALFHSPSNFKCIRCIYLGNPFYGQPAVLNTMEQTIWNVTVESLNCEGRRVKVIHIYALHAAVSILGSYAVVDCKPVVHWYCTINFFFYHV